MPAWAQGEPALYEGSGGWGVVAGLPDSAKPPGPEWTFENGLWVGRISADADRLAWGDRILPVAEGVPLPLAPSALSPTSNPFGPCVVRSLSVRYDSVVRSRRWSLVFTPEGGEADFVPLELFGGREAPLALVLEDAVSGQRWNLRPERMGREGSLFSRQGGDARFYAGTIDGGDVDWNLIVSPGAGGRQVLQGRILLMQSPTRLLRLRVLLRTGAPAVPGVQEELPPVLVAATGGTAVALFADLAEPRRFRAVTNESGMAGFEYDLAVTKLTGNFPRSATFSLEVGSWGTADARSAAQEALMEMPRAGGGLDLPEPVERDGVSALVRLEPGLLRMSHPGGFRDPYDVMQYLMMRTSGIFPDHAWASSAFLCAAQDAEGGTRIQQQGDAARVAVNADPDLDAMLEMGQNRGKTVLERIRSSGAKAVWLNVSASPSGLDYNTRALRLCDYPALWEEGVLRPGVDLRHAESELFSALACVLKEEGICLLVSDAGPMAPFTTYHADALVCEADDPAEMRRQRELAGPRPVLWLAEGAGPEAEALARNLGFVRPGRITEN
jgi:hypothetical protein